jgi:hypothetical protein
VLESVLHEEIKDPLQCFELEKKEEIRHNNYAEDKERTWNRRATDTEQAEALDPTHIALEDEQTCTTLRTDMQENTDMVLNEQSPVEGGSQSHWKFAPQA